MENSMKLKTLLGASLLVAAWAGSAFAQTRLVTLGTQGGPLSSSTRSQPANALIVGDKVYVIDAGDGVLRQLYAAGIDLRKVRQIFITHDHDDHNAWLGLALGVQWDLGIWPVDVYAPSAQVHDEGLSPVFLGQRTHPPSRLKSGKAAARESISCA
jgi:ribonuclease BN (tRNA processing enzyme)